LIARFPDYKWDTLVCTELLEKCTAAELEKVTNIIAVSKTTLFRYLQFGAVPKVVLNSSHIHDLKAGTEDYRYEIQKNRNLEDIAGNLALEVCYFNLGEYHKSGALLSCMVMHLNRNSYKVALTA
jgi:hypothetical protein